MSVEIGRVLRRKEDISRGDRMRRSSKDLEAIEMIVESRGVDIVKEHLWMKRDASWWRRDKVSEVDLSGTIAKGIGSKHRIFLMRNKQFNWSNCCSRSRGNGRGRGRGWWWDEDDRFVEEDSDINGISRIVSSIWRSRVYTPDSWWGGVNRKRREFREISSLTIDLWPLVLKLIHEVRYRLSLSLRGEELKTEVGWEMRGHRREGEREVSLLDSVKERERVCSIAREIGHRLARDRGVEENEGELRAVAAAVDRGEDDRYRGIED
jgi:hypothetical protein